MFRSVIDSGQAAIKSAFLLNGGAAIALLAFIGKLSEKSAPKIEVFASSLVWFVTGVLIITLTSAFTYLTQWFGHHSTPKMEKASYFLNLFTIILGLSSFVTFIMGVIEANKGFLGLG